MIPPGFRPAKAMERNHGGVLVGLSLVVYVLVSVSLTWSLFGCASPRLRETEDRDVASYNECMRRARNLTAIWDHDHAKLYLQLAMDIAPTPEMRAHAAIELGRIETLFAHEKYIPHALVARQYLRSAVEQAQDPEDLKKAWHLLMQLAELNKDATEVREAAGQIVALTDRMIERAEVRFAELKACLAYGTYAQAQAALRAARSTFSDLPQDERFVMIAAEVSERILRDPDWFEEYAQRRPDEDHTEIRERLFENTIATYRALFDVGGPAIKEECLFRIARLYCDEEMYEEAERTIQEFLSAEATIHLPDVLLMLVRIAKAEGDTVSVTQLINTFLKRYPADAGRAVDVYKVIEYLNELGRPEDALDVAKQFIKMPARRAAFPEFIYQAALLANRLGLRDEAEGYFHNYLETMPHGDRLSEVLITLAEISLQRQDYRGAEHWLQMHLTMLPHDPRRGDALFLYFDIARDMHASFGSQFVLGAVAAAARPQDPRALDTLMIIGTLMEKVGLYTMAEAQYNRNAILYYLAADAGRTGVPPATAGAAMVGKARSLIGQGEEVKADRLLRELCRVLPPSAVRSEAAFLWAQIAYNMGQHEEAARRLDLGLPVEDDPVLQARIEYERDLWRALPRRSVALVLEDMLGYVQFIPQAEQAHYVRRAYNASFEEMLARGDLSGMEVLLGQAMQHPYHAELPLRKWAIRIMDLVLAERGTGGLVEYIQTRRLNMDLPDIPMALDQSLIEAVRSFGELNKQMELLL